MSGLPIEAKNDGLCLTQHHTERFWAWRACLASPLLALVVWGLAARYLLFVLYLKPPTPLASLTDALFWKPSLGLGVLTFAAPWCWWASTRWTCGRGRFPWSALLAVVAVAGFCVALDQPRLKWFFVEWCLIRTPSSSFARNTLKWEQRQFERTSSRTPSAPLVRLVGSSQIYQGTDLAVLESALPDVVWEKNCLAGFGPLQYPWLLEVLLDPPPRMVVCWLSEFDFFREDELPVNRLRWASTSSGVARLYTAVNWPTVDISERTKALTDGRNWPDDISDQWSLRCGYTDLEVAALVPLWRERDHFRQVFFHYWQDLSNPAEARSATEPQLAESAGMEQARISLGNNVGRKRLVDANFDAFAQFARELSSRGITLLVCEGTTHPDATVVYDPELRNETRRRLQQLSETTDFQYLDESQLPRLTRDEFVDPYHLN